MKKETTMEIRTFENVQRPEVFTALAAEIKAHVEKNKLFMVFKDKTGKVNPYPVVEAWQFAGALLGLFPRLTELTDLAPDKDAILKYRATVEIVDSRTDKVVGRGIAICSNIEKNKMYFDEYAIASMAQTRATGKAFRLCLGWLLKASGFESTPAEELDWQEDESKGGKRNFDPAILREYENFAVMAVGFCERAADVQKLVQASPALKEVPRYIDSARDAFKQLRDAGQ